MATQDHWAFLLQQEGDREWIPLDAPDMAIVEGRYRIIARSRRRQTAAEISIAHTRYPSPDQPDAPPKRRSKKRAAKTNDKGFLLVLPFTTMQPGTWEFRCASDVMSELMGEGWQHALQLTVQPQPIEAALETEWAAIAPPVVQPIATIDPVAAELEHIFVPPISPAPATVNDPITLGGDALSLDDLFGEASAALAIDGGNDLASELAAIGVPDAEPDLEASDLEVDVWSAPLDDRTTPAALTQLEIVSDNDETLLDWDASRLINRTSIGPDVVPAPPAVASNDDDDFSVFDELFSSAPPATNVDIGELNALLSEEDAADSDAVITFTDVDALAVTAETDSPIAPDEITEPLVSAMPPSLWGIGTRTGATAQMGVTASPGEVAALIDDADVVADGGVADGGVVDGGVVDAVVDGGVVDGGDALPFGTTHPTVEIPRVEIPVLTIDLDPGFYNFRGGEVLMVYGAVTAATMPASIAQGELVVKLVDPQTATQVAEYRQALDRQALPLSIAAPLSVPPGMNTQLLVGEVAIWDDGVEELAQQSFTAMAAVDDLMAAIDPHIVAEEYEKATPTVPMGGDAPLPPVDFAFFNLIGDAPENAAELAPLKKRETMKDVELPGTSPAPGMPRIAPLETVDDSIFAIDDLELENPLAPEPIADLDPLDRSLNVDGAGITSTSGQPLPDDWFDLSVATDADETTPDNSVAAVVEPVVEPVVVEPVVELVIEPVVEEIAVPIGNPDPAASEVVVDDLPEALPTPQKAETGGNPLLIPADQPIPEPTIEIVGSGELVTGQAVRVRVKLPNILPKLYVKLWINDRQSRTLMDGPRWMVDFVPNGRDELETTTQLTVPFGSLEIQIAAIAVEAATKRESYRTAIDREVIPPNLEDEMSELDFDNL
jgi:hypothetical protein